MKPVLLGIYYDCLSFVERLPRSNHVATKTRALRYFIEVGFTGIEYTLGGFSPPMCEEKCIPEESRSPD